MTVKEIFSNLTNHMVKGLMVHDQMIHYYLFLELEGYAKCHKYHYYEESKTYNKVVYHYFKYHNKLIEPQKIDNPNLIPQSWYQYEQKDVDINTKRSAVKSGLEEWLKWEKETEKLYKTFYKELLTLEEYNDAKLLEELLCHVTEEIAEINKYCIEKKSTDYNINAIMEEQTKKKHKYRKKLHNKCCYCD